MTDLAPDGRDSLDRQRHAKSVSWVSRGWRQIVRRIAIFRVRRNSIDEVFHRQGAAAARLWARDRSRNRFERSLYLMRLARLAIVTDVVQAKQMALEAVELDAQLACQSWLAFLLFDAGEIRLPAELISGLDWSKFKPAEIAKARYIQGCARCMSPVFDLTPVRDKPPMTETNQVLYVTSSSLPHHVSGYTTRTHSILTAMKQKGWQVRCITRPGYPMDRSDAQSTDFSFLETVDGIEYLALNGPHRRKTPLDEYLLEAASIIERQARSDRPCFIHAASNYESALPALIAARRLGLPFIYEVRGLWEYTTASNRAGWEKTERFYLDRTLESYVATNADRVLTLTRALSGELMARGVSSSKLFLLPNAVDPTAFSRRPYDRDLARELGIGEDCFVVGYIGSIVRYEGLDDLVVAFQKLRQSGIKSKLLIVGAGSELPALEALIQKECLTGDVILTGRVSPQEVVRYFSLLEAMALPRKPYSVCQLVSPLKPLEAMAAQVPLVVSDVSALAEMVRHDQTALICQAGNADSLSAALRRLALDKALRVRLSSTAYAHVVAERTWQQVTANLTESYEALRSQSAELAPKGPGFTS